MKQTFCYPNEVYGWIESPRKLPPTGAVEDFSLYGVIAASQIKRNITAESARFGLWWEKALVEELKKQA